MFPFSSMSWEWNNEFRSSQARVRDLVSISSMFFVQLLRSQILNAQKRQSSQQCHLALLGPTGVKAVHRVLMKLTPGVHFTNILWAAFTHSDLKSAKKTDSLTVFFALLGSARVKAAHKMMMKLALAFSLFFANVKQQHTEFTMSSYSGFLFRACS